MGACVGASIELACREKGLRYIPRHEVLSRNGKAMRLPLSQFSPRKALVPDELFGIDYNGAYRFFACEWDRNTEPLTRKANDQIDFAKKLACYVEVMRNRTYKDEWGIPGMMVLIVTTNHTRAESILAQVQGLDQRIAERFALKVVPQFATPWRMPSILTDILDPWVTVAGKFDITKSAP